MITIYINKNKYAVNKNSTLQQVLTQFNFVNDYMAVAVNKLFIMRAAYAETIVAANDEIDIVTPMQGG